MDAATVLVSGAPGAGKTTLAVPLARALGFSLLSKDHIKETLFDALPGPGRDLSWSRLIGGASMELLWSLAGRCPKVVLEANFRPHSQRERDHVRRLTRPLVEVWCRCPAEICASRFAQRAINVHPAHPLVGLTAEMLAEFGRPMGQGPVVAVDTTRQVDIERLAADVLKHLSRATAQPQNRFPTY